MIGLFRDTFQPPGGEMDSWMWEWGFSLGWPFLAIMAAFWIAVVSGPALYC